MTRTELQAAIDAKTKAMDTGIVLLRAEVAAREFIDASDTAESILTALAELRRLELLLEEVE